MFHRVVAASLVAIWLALIGFEYTRDDNFSGYYRAPSMIAAANLDSPDDVQKKKPPTLSIRLVFFFVSSSALVFLPHFTKELMVAKDDFKPYKLNRTFLI